MAGAVRQPIDVCALERYLENNVPTIKTPITIKQFGFGQSNPTYQLISSDGSKFVLRKKPPGKLLSKTAHQIEREYRIIRALETTEVPVPKAYCLCQDDTVVGTAFYIMEFLDGRIFEDPAIPSVCEQERSELWRDAIQTLAKIHSVDLLSVGLERLGKHGGFFDRQIRTFNAVSESQAGVEDIETKVPVGYPPHFHDIVSFLSIRETQPPDRSTLIHGDYKIDNIVFHKTKPCVIGILDWEMGAIGHPLSDICNVTAPLIAPRLSRISANYSPGTHGLPSRQDCIRWYQEVSGWVPTPDLLWGDAFYAFKSSVIMQGIAARYSRRQASSALAKEYGELMVPFAVLAKKRAEEIKKNAEDRASLSYDGASKM